ncbi:MAG TPA: TonB-dependent receptor, partial [Pseudomonadales bacterium]|nr:TonB-dependent receptor [Pseudomonadales bacterium]
MTGKLFRTLLPLLAISAPVQAEPNFDVNSLMALSLGELANVRVTSVASGSATEVAKAPGVTYIITDQDIQAMGAYTLTQALRGVPGLYVGLSDQALAPLFEFRGITSALNPQTLMLINGLPLTSLAFGNRGNGIHDWPTALIKRIEIIRGPGSALYGADAVAGVINIITKSTPADAPVEIGARIGSFNTKESWLLSGAQIADWQLSIGVDAGTTSGNDAIVASDKQTALDHLTGTRVSRAPGPLNAGYDWAESRIELSKDDWKFRVGYEGRRNAQTGMGITTALDPQGRFLADYVNADLSRKFTTQNWDVTPEISLQTMSQENTKDDLLYPPGAQIPVADGTLRYFPDGLIGNPSFRERQYRAALTSRYVGFNRHRLLMGLGIAQSRIYDVEEYKNFDAQLNPLPAPIEVQNNPSLIWMPERSRTNNFALAQDEWQFAPRWQLVTGLRFDHYSDFGDSANPRLALIWDTAKQVTSKLLYGEAFRAPSVQELFVQANPTALGDPNLKAEKIQTYELAFAYDPSVSHHLGLGLFHYKLRDLITDRALASGQVQRANDGARSGNGFEIEWDKNWRD